jgi:hypothetical protein
LFYGEIKKKKERRKFSHSRKAKEFWIMAPGEREKSFLFLLFVLKKNKINKKL